MVSTKADDNSGYIGAAIVGLFVMVVSGWYGSQWIYARLGREGF
jgi:high-affinity nickel-transport protein